MFRKGKKRFHIQGTPLNGSPAYNAHARAKVIRERVPFSSCCPWARVEGEVLRLAATGSDAAFARRAQPLASEPS